MRINKHDTNGTKPLLGKGELGYDDYSAGGDTGRVYVGNGASNIALAKKSEVDAKVVANAGITAGTATKVTYDAKGLVVSGTTLSAVDIPVLDAGKITTGTLPVTIGGTGTTTSTGTGSTVLSTSPVLVTPTIGVATGTSFNSITGLSSTKPVMDGTATAGTGVTVARADHVHPKDTTKVDANANITAGTYKSVTVDVKGLVTGGTNPTTLGGYGITDTYTKTETNTQISTAVNGLVDAAPGTLDTLNELAAALGDDPNFATTTANNIANKVTRVTSTDNAVVRFDGTTGDVQNSSVIVDDAGNMAVGSPTVISKLTVSNASDNDTAYAGISLLRHGSTYGSNIFHNYNSSLNKETLNLSVCSNTDLLDPQYTKYRITADGTHIWYGNTTSKELMILNTNGDLTHKGNFTSGHMLWNDNAQAASNSWYHFYGTSSNNTFSNIAIYGNGNIVNANNSYGAISDIKLKENITDTSSKLDKLMQVRVVNYNLIGDEQKQIGVIAQEIEQIFPSIVDVTKDTKQVEVKKERIIPAVEEVTDEEGNIIQEAVTESVETYTETETVETGETTKNVKYSVIYMMMLKGMQEMRAEYTSEIASLKQEIELLKGAK